MDLQLRGKTALITGASKGIGYASAEALAEEGVNVILVSRTQADLEAARERIAARCNVRTEIHAYDIADSRNVDRLAEQHPDIDILVNNAGAIPGGNLQEIDEARWRQAWDLKVYRLHQHVPSLLRRDEAARPRHDHQHHSAWRASGWTPATSPAPPAMPA